MSDRSVALITGAGSGIGLATAVRLAEDGIAIVGTARSSASLDALKAALPDHHPLAVIAQDVTEADAPQRAVALAMERFGRLDFMVNNAGIGKPSPVHETDDALLDLFLGVHLRAPFRFCREALGVMGKGAAIVNIASSFALIGGLRGGAYSAAKSGIIGLTKHMAAQYGPLGIRSNVVAPGVIPTAMTEYAWESERFRRMNFEMTPMDRNGTPEDIANAIAFLLSSEAGFINGQVLAVDGGWTTTKYLSDDALGAVRVSTP